MRSCVACWQQPRRVLRNWRWRLTRRKHSMQSRQVVHPDQAARALALFHCRSIMLTVTLCALTVGRMRSRLDVESIHVAAKDRHSGCGQQAHCGGVGGPSDCECSISRALSPQGRNSPSDAVRLGGELQSQARELALLRAAVAEAATPVATPPPPPSAKCDAGCLAKLPTAGEESARRALVRLRGQLDSQQVGGSQHTGLIFTALTSIAWDRRRLLPR